MERKRTLLRALLIGLVCGAMMAAVSMAAPSANPGPAGPAGPGTLNYIEGQVYVNGQAVTSKSVGSEAVQPGQVLSTGAGKVEMLLTPGVFLRLGDNSQVRMTTSGLADMRVALLQGQATVEADNLVKETHLTIDQGMASTRILKKGFYLVNATQPFVQVLDGKAQVALNGQDVKVGKGDSVVLDASNRLKKQGFRIENAQNEALVRWSRLRSSYESQANIDTANYVASNDGGWYGPGWYWDAGFGSWSYLPGDGILYNPWGFGFYSPFYAPVFFGGGYYGGGFHGGFHDRGVDRAHEGVHGGVRGGFRGNAAAGMRPAAGGFHGGGAFHGGGGAHVGGHR